MWFVWVLVAALGVGLAAHYGQLPPKAKHWLLLRAFGKGASDEPQPRLFPSDVVVDRQLSDEDDADLFEYREIADRVAELVAGAVHPVHVGVFGAWGAGKSSFLTLVHLRLADLAGARLRPALGRIPQFLVVRYDAWRYGGQALRRDLIAVAAKELGVKRRRFRAGLFESRQVVRLEMNEFIRRIWSFLMGVLVLLMGLGALLAVGALVLLVLSAVFDRVTNPIDLIKGLSFDWGKVLAWVSAGLAVLSAPNLLGVTVNRSSPSQDDEFARNLKALIREAELVRPVRFLSRWTWLVARLPVWCRRRVVFFIDELDRASDTEVLNTLTALQTQFADANVSVIVAADREVIEKALENRETQRRPERAWDPYLSGSDSFLDKVFQHTFVLPPLRTERITEFARTQVSQGNGGLWSQIDTEGFTDDVLYALIPSHVLSPRRIKVLLNAYATQSRVAEARRLPTAGLRLELAVWVVLQLEFPRFAADLKVEPTLRRVMLEPADEFSGKLNRMYSRHRLLNEPATNANDSDWLEWNYRIQLHEYLEATNQVPDIPFQLLFLETAGSAIGHFSEEVATALDRADRMEPSRVLSDIGALDDSTLDRAIQFVAERSRAAISVGRDRAVLVMAGLIAQHSTAPLGRSAAAALDAYRRYTPHRPVPPDAVVAQIRTFAEAAPADLESLLRTIEDRDDAPHVAVIAERLVIPEACAPEALDHLAAWFAENMSPFVLSALANSGKTDLIERCIDRSSLSVLAAIRELLALNSPEGEEEDETVAATSLAATVPVGAHDDDDLGTDPAVDLLNVEAVRQLVTSLSPGAAILIAREFTMRVAAGEPTSALATDLLDSRADAATKGALASALIVSDPNHVGLEAWVTYAIDSPDSEAQAEAASALLGRLTPDTDTQAVSATFNQVTRLTNDDTRAAIASAATTSLTNLEWDAGDEPSRAEHGSAVINWMAENHLPGYRELALQEARAKLLPALTGDLPMATLTQDLGHLGKHQVADLDRDLNSVGITRRDEPVPALRILTTRLVLRRRFPGTLAPITPAVVSRIYNSTVATDDREAITARAAVLNEWFAVHRTDKDVLPLIRSLKRVFPTQLARWMPTVTTTQATNAWVQASKNWNVTYLGPLTKAVPLDTTKVAKRMRDLAGSDNPDTRTRALAIARQFPKGRTDSDRAVQEVAQQFAGRGADERRRGYKLLADYKPKRLLPDIRDFILGVPKSFLRSKAEKALNERTRQKRK